jgi:hypothetical protein
LIEGPAIASAAELSYAVAFTRREPVRRTAARPRRQASQAFRVFNGAIGTPAESESVE